MTNELTTFIDSLKWQPITDDVKESGQWVLIHSSAYIDTHTPVVSFWWDNHWTRWQKLEGNGIPDVYMPLPTDKAAEVIEVLVEAMKFMADGCLVPPDGGSPRIEDYYKSAQDALKQAKEIIQGEPND